MDDNLKDLMRELRIDNVDDLTPITGKNNPLYWYHLGCDDLENNNVFNVYQFKEQYYNGNNLIITFERAWAKYCMGYVDKSGYWINKE